MLEVLNVAKVDTPEDFREVVLEILHEKLNEVKEQTAKAKRPVQTWRARQFGRELELKNLITFFVDLRIEPKGKGRPPC